MLAWIDTNVTWGVALLLCATLGLAPFSPPHIVEKLQMLAGGTLVRPLDWFDLLFHASPWVLLGLKALAAATQPGSSPA